MSRPQDGAGWPCAASWRTRSHEPESAARIPCCPGRESPRRRAGLRRRTPGSQPAEPPPHRAAHARPESDLSPTGRRAVRGRRTGGIRRDPLTWEKLQILGLLLPSLPGWRGTLWPHPSLSHHALHSATPTLPSSLAPTPLAPPTHTPCVRPQATSCPVPPPPKPPIPPRKTQDKKGRWWCPRDPESLYSSLSAPEERLLACAWPSCVLAGEVMS